MKSIRIVLFMAISLLASAGLAHEGHDAEPLDQARAIAVAAETKLQLIEDGKLAASWAAIDSPTASLVRQEGIQNWVVSYMDASAHTGLTLVFTNTGTFVSMANSASASHTH
jgi:hypothetical protein